MNGKSEESIEENQKEAVSGPNRGTEVDLSETNREKGPEIHEDVQKGEMGIGGSNDPIVLFLVHQSGEMGRERGHGNLFDLLVNKDGDHHDDLPSCDEFIKEQLAEEIDRNVAHFGGERRRKRGRKGGEEEKKEGKREN